jgi:predicted  nucleic acid-binding Zn-ribbon protein
MHSQQKALLISLLQTHEVHNHPLSRRYQETFVSLKSELETVITALTDQQRVLVALDNSISEGEAKSVCNVRTQKEQGREASIVESALQSTEETLANFGEMLRRVTELESWVCLCFGASCLFQIANAAYPCSTSELSKQLRTTKKKLPWLLPL